jgi:hypothetical protein
MPEPFGPAPSKEMAMCIGYDAQENFVELKECENGCKCVHTLVGSRDTCVSGSSITCITNSSQPICWNCCSVYELGFI